MEAFWDQLGLPVSGPLVGLSELAVLVLVATLVYFVVRSLLLRGLRAFAASSSTHWDDAFVRAGVFGRFAHIAPALVVYYGLELLPAVPVDVSGNARHAVLAFMLIVLARTLRSTLVAAEAIVEQTGAAWDDEFARAGVFQRLRSLVAPLILYIAVGVFPELPVLIAEIARRLAGIAIAIGGALALASVLRAGEAIYDTRPQNQERPIKGYVQIATILLYLIAGLLGISALLDRSPWILLSGVGALTAVILLVFRDTILSFVASIQIASDNLVRVGDWIEMPQLGADGDVVEIALHTVKVQNWDKTITTIPTHRLISESFKNWRGMSDAGGRRIKRSVSIDLQSVRFLTDEEIERFGHWALLRDYIGGKRDELATANASEELDVSIDADLRRLTNLGTFRAWIWALLRAHPQIHQAGYTLLVRQLAAGPQGVPIEIYCFSNDTNWIAFEDIQADLFDRILSMVPEFGLRVFQEPAGSDVERLTARDADALGTAP